MKSVVPKWFTLFVFVLTFAIGISVSKADITLQLAWDPSPDPSVTGYNLYYGEVGQSTSQKVSVGSNTYGTLTGLTVGKSYAIYVTAVDGTGVESEPSNSITYTPSAGVQLAPIGQKTVAEGFTLAFNLSTVDPSGTAGPLTYSLVLGPVGASVSASGAFSWIPGESQGPSSYIITVRVSNQGVPQVSDTDSFTVDVTEVNRAPVLAPVSDQSGTVGSPITAQLSATDPDLPSNALTYSLVSGPIGATVNQATGAFSWTPTAAQQSTSSTVTVKVTDNGTPALSDSKTFAVAVTAANNPPVFGAIPNLMVAAGTSLTWQLTAVDPQGSAQKLTYALVSGPAGANVDPASGVFTWTPAKSLASSTADVTVKATDNGTPALSGSKSFSIMVTAPNAAPVLAAVADQTATSGSQLRVQLKATDADVPGQTLTYSLVSGPSGAAVNPTTGLFTWTPVAGQAPSSAAATVLVSDNGPTPLTDTKSFKITLAGSGNRPPVLSAIRDQTIAPGQVVMLSLSATDPDGSANKLTYQLVSGPKDAWLSSSTGLFVWRLSKSASAATYTVVVSVSDNGSPSLSDTKTFKIVVTPKSGRSSDYRTTNLGSVNWVAEIDETRSVKFNYPLQANKQSGEWVHYLEASEDLVNWVMVGPISDLSELRDSGARGVAKRFYRIRSENETGGTTENAQESIAAE